MRSNNTHNIYGSANFHTREENLGPTLTDRIIQELEEGPLTAVELACILAVELRRVRGMLFQLHKRGRVNKITIKPSRKPRGGRVLWVGVSFDMPNTALTQPTKPKHPVGSGVIAGPLKIRGYRWDLGRL